MWRGYIDIPLFLAQFIEKRLLFLHRIAFAPLARKLIVHIGVGFFYSINLFFFLFTFILLWLDYCSLLAVTSCFIILAVVLGFRIYRSLTYIAELMLYLQLTFHHYMYSGRNLYCIFTHLPFPQVWY